MNSLTSFAAWAGLPAGLFSNLNCRVQKVLAVAALLVLAVVQCDAADEHPFLHPLFCDHAVLQRGVSVPVWGWSAPGSKVTVKFAGQSQSVVADASGKWMVKLKSMRASSEPRVLSVTNSTTHESAAISDVLVGDVWLCSGQSNMEMGMSMCNVPNEIAAANFPRLRLLTVPHRIAMSPVDGLECRWLPCSPDALKEGGWGGFSATAFFFGRELQRDLNIPVGLIHSSWGGTIAEAWTSAEGLKPLGDFDQAVASVREQANNDRSMDYPQIYEKWCQQHDLGTQQGWATAEKVDWPVVQMPQAFESAGLPNFDGMVWFHHEFELPADWAGKDLKLEFGSVDDFDTTWFNGVKVGQQNRVDVPRIYTVPASTVKPGKNVITMRVLDTGGPGGFSEHPQAFRVSVAGSEAAPISLAGNWQMSASTPLDKLGPVPPPPGSNNPNVPTVLYNGMISPLLPFAIKGAIWYQGESNADRAKQYRRLLPAMIGDWRTRFGVGDFPFYIVQLAAFQATNAEPRDNNWAELREAQALTAQQVPNCGLALAIDIGDAADIHPKNKREVGRRLALNALAKTYGKKVECSGPWYRSMKVDGNKVRLEFDHVDGGLEARGGKLTGFAIAGADQKFVWADAVIAGKTVIVSSSQVPAPVAVRYAWDINPVCNLYNQAGLPAVPFRTDEAAK